MGRDRDRNPAAFLLQLLRVRTEQAWQIRRVSHLDHHGIDTLAGDQQAQGFELIHAPRRIDDVDDFQVFYVLRKILFRLETAASARLCE